MLASAQAITLRRDVDTTGEYTFGVAECGADITVKWAFNAAFLTGVFCSPLVLWTTATDCGDSPVTTAGDQRLDDVQTLDLQTKQTGTFTVKVSTLPGFNTTTADGGTNTDTCGTTGITKTHHVCGSFGVQTAGLPTCTKTSAANLSLIYDTKPPAVPTDLVATAEDSAALVQFSVDGDAVTVRAEVLAPGETNFAGAEEATATSKQVRVKNLTNGQVWTIRLRAVDSAGNVSEPSAAVEVTPVATIGFFGVYRQAGGTDQGGCSAAGAALVPFAALALARAFARRSRRS